MVNETSINDIKETFERQGTFFMTIAKVLDNNCQCHVCSQLRGFLLQKAKEHDVKTVLEKANKDVKT